MKSVREPLAVAHVPDDVEARELDKVARAELKTLSKDNADWVAKHLVMAGRLIEEDPQEAHAHALSAGRRAGRIGVVRETIAITAYTVGDYALALRELRTYRRISGRDDHLPLMVDSERGLERPEKALELARSVDAATLEVPVRVQLAIAMSGARLDLGQADAALRELEIPQLDPSKAYRWSPELFAAYATVLEELDRADEAARWWALSERADAALETARGDDDRETVEVVEEDLAVDEDLAEEAPVPLDDDVASDDDLADDGASTGTRADEDDVPEVTPDEDDAPQVTSDEDEDDAPEGTAHEADVTDEGERS